MKWASKAGGMWLLGGLALLFSGCSTALAPRTAEIAKPGELTGDLHLKVANVGVGRAEVSRPTDIDGEEVRQVFQESGALHQAIPLPWLAYLYPAAAAGSVRLGVFEPCEVGPMLSILRFGVEARCGVLSQADGSPVSMSLASALAHQTLLSKGGPWWRGGLDVSSRLNAWQLMTNVHLSYGPQIHAFKLGTLPDDAVESEDDSFIVDVLGDAARVGSWARVERDELRLNLGLGVGWQAEENTWLSLSLVPNVALHTGETHRASCTNCSALEVDRLTEDFSVDLIASVGWSPEEEFYYSSGDKKGLEVAGWTLLGSGYAAFVGPLVMMIVASEASFSDHLLLAIPAAGPFLWSNAVSGTGDLDTYGPLMDITVHGMGTLQAVGVLMLSAAYLFFDVDTDASQLLLQPGIMGEDAVGMTTQGEF